MKNCKNLINNFQKKRARFQKYDSKEPGEVKSTTVEIKISIKEIMMENQDFLINVEADKKALQNTMKALEKATHGGARPGAGRKRKDTEARNKTIAISGTETEIKTIRQKAKSSGKTTSRFLIELAMEER